MFKSCHFISFPSHLISFHPETAFFRGSRVNLQAYLCGVTVYASAQALDFLATTEKLLVSNLKT